jgi:hypothetical protein
MIEGEERYARLSARLLIEQQGECPPTQEDLRRDAVVAAMALDIAAKARRRRVVVASVLALAAAASVLVVLRLAGGSSLSGSKASGSELVVERATGNGNYLVRAGSIQPLLDFGVLAVADSVRSGADSSAMLGFGNGTRITVSSSAQLRIDDLGSTRRFSLLGGHLQAHVTKLVPGERFVVTTPGSEVEVRGTEFTVAVDSPPAGCRDLSSITTVHVSEGAVWVRSGGEQVVLQPGETWATPCPDPRSMHAAESAVRAPAVAPSAIAPSVRAGTHRPATPRVTGTAAPVLGQREWPIVPSPTPEPTRIDTPAPLPSVSRLTEQNDLFSAAMVAERQGQHDLALRKLNELIAHYPSGPLSESARAEQQRILAAQRSH